MKVTVSSRNMNAVAFIAVVNELDMKGRPQKEVKDSAWISLLDLLLVTDPGGCRRHCGGVWKRWRCTVIGLWKTVGTQPDRSQPLKNGSVIIWRDSFKKIIKIQRTSGKTSYRWPCLIDMLCCLSTHSPFSLSLSQDRNTGHREERTERRTGPRWKNRQLSSEGKTVVVSL